MNAELSALLAPLFWLATSLPTAAQDAPPLERHGNRPAAIEHAQPAERPSLTIPDNWTTVAEQDGAIMASGPRWRAHFDGDGVRFIPALGALAPASRHLELRTRTLRVGSLPLAIDAQRGATRRNAEFIETPLSNSITERFGVHPRGLQLEYWIEHLPTRSGDLVIELDLLTELTHRGRDGHGVQLFDDGARGSAASIGAVFAIDAAGARVQGTTEVEVGTLTLRLPQSFLATAELPLRIDPLITGPLEGPGGGVERQAEFAYSDRSDRWGIAWTRYFSAQESIVTIAVFDTPGTVNVFAPFLPVGSYHSPTIAYSRRNDRFVLTYVEGPEPFGPFDLKCFSFDAAADGAFISGSGLVSLRTDLIRPPRPRSADAPLDAFGQVLIVYADDDRVRLARVDPLMTVPPTLLSDVDLGPGSLPLQPVISRGGGDTGRYLVAWQQTSGANLQQLRLQTVSRTGSALGSSLTLANGGADLLHPAIDGASDEWLLAYEMQASPGDSDILARKLSYTGLGLAPDAVLALEAEFGDDERDPAVARVGSKYLVAWADERQGFGAGPFEYDVQYLSLDSASCELCEPETLLSSSPEWRGDLQFATQQSSGADAGAGSNFDTALLSWDQLAVALPQDGAFHYALLEATGDSPIAIDTGGGCGAGGALTHSGPLAVGAPAKFALSGAALTSSLAFLAIAPPGAPFLCGPCAWVPWQQLLLPTPVLAGAASQTIGVPCNPLLIGRSYELQWTVVAPGEVPCAIAPDLALSNRLAIEIGL